MNTTNTKAQVILVGVNTGDITTFNKELEELEGLATADNFEVVGRLVQNLESFDSRSYIGEGKLNELKNLVNTLDADIVIFNDELTPNQVRTLDKAIKCDILDRSLLILDIFAQRARSQEAIIQVEMASLQYRLTRLVGSSENLGRQRGGVRNKGSGEKKIDLDRSMIKRRISYLKKQLSKISKTRNIKSGARTKLDLPLVALVGYTNAGKSTLMNSLIHSFNKGKSDNKVEVKDMLFTTLDTTTRLVEADTVFILSDTVGFIDKLPHNLIEAFHSTLEGIKDADILLHVVDYSDDYERKMKIVDGVLNELDVADKPTIVVFNKCDKVEGSVCPCIKDNTIYLSAALYVGFEQLQKLILSTLKQIYFEYKFFVPYEEISSYHKIASSHIITHKSEDEKGVYFSILTKYQNYQKYAKYQID